MDNSDVDENVSEKAKRDVLAKERRKIRRRTTTAPMPTVAQIVSAWDVRNDSYADVICLGSILHDLECFVDNSLIFDDDDTVGGRGNICGRMGGICGWINENVPKLSRYYKSLMRYKSIVKKIRQIYKIEDPTSTMEYLMNGKLAPLFEEFEMQGTKQKNLRLFDTINTVLNRLLKESELYSFTKSHGEIL